MKRCSYLRMFQITYPISIHLYFQISKDLLQNVTQPLPVVNKRKSLILINLNHIIIVQHMNKILRMKNNLQVNVLKICPFVTIFLNLCFMLQLKRNDQESMVFARKM